MEFLFFLAVVAAVFLWLRSLLLRQGRGREGAGAAQDSSPASGPADSYANPYEPRDYDGGCRSPDTDGPASSDSGGDGSGGGGD